MTRLRHTLAGVGAAVIAVAGAAAGAWGQADCTGTSVGFTPINDLGTGLYLGQFEGGLYPGGANAAPAAHAAAGVARALGVVPRNVAGQPDPGGRYVLLSIGMSNTTQEFCCGPGTFMGRAAVNPAVNHATLAIVNGARGGQSAATWDSPAEANYDRIRDQELVPRGLSEAQVQAAWVKVANPGPMVSLPSTQADAYALLRQMGDIVRAMKVRYPNLRLVFLSSRIYAGYASTALNPEPYAHESGFAVKWLIEAQINQMAGGPPHAIAGNLDYGSVAPWVGWGPYLWADGLMARSDGLIWECADLSQNDGTHPSASGVAKVGLMLLAFMLDSEYASPWFRAGPGGPCPPDWNEDGLVNSQDFFDFLGDFFAGSADFNNNGETNSADFFDFVRALVAGCP